MSASPAPTSSCPSPVPPCIQQKHVSPRCHCQRGFCRCTSLLCCERSPGQVSCQSILSTVLGLWRSFRCRCPDVRRRCILPLSRALFSVCSVSFSRSHVFLSFSSPSLHTAEACQPQMSLSKRLLPCTSLLCCERSPGQVSCQSILSTVCLVSGGASVVVVQMLEGGASYLCFSRALFSVCSSNFSRSHVFLSFSSPSLHTAEACQPQMSLSKRLLPLHKPVVL